MASRDLDDRGEIAELVRRFYARVAQDDLLGPMFEDVARVDWSTHLPKITELWCRVLLGEGDYHGNPYLKHLAVHERRPFTAAHFERWLALFEETLDATWSGPLVETAKTFAANVARVHGERLVGPPAEPAVRPRPMQVAGPTRRSGSTR